MRQTTLSGVVQSEENKERLPFANLIIKGTAQGTSTNVDGYFSRVGMPEEAFTLQIVSVGFAIKDIEIESGSEDIEKLKIQLSSRLTIEEEVIQGKSFKVMNPSDGISIVQ